jgi:hypothetical protein
MRNQILKSQAKSQIAAGARGNRNITFESATVIRWYGHPLPEGVTFVGDETLHPVGKNDLVWRCWWYKNGKMDYITLDANTSHEERIQTTLTIMRMSDGNTDKREGSNPS